MTVLLLVFFLLLPYLRLFLFHFSSYEFYFFVGRRNKITKITPKCVCFFFLGAIARRLTTVDCRLTPDVTANEWIRIRIAVARHTESGGAIVWVLGRYLIATIATAKINFQEMCELYARDVDVFRMLDL